MNDLVLDKVLRRSDRGTRVRLIQEWLSLNGFGVLIDGEFGPATEMAVKRFQRLRGLREDGIVGQRTFDALIEPMTQALESIPAGDRSLGQLVVAYARRHLAASPREVGGQNRGPWVRLYMDGREGAEWAWCGGFVCFLLGRACEGLGVPRPIVFSVSCDSLAASAKAAQRFLPGEGTWIKPGSVREVFFFLGELQPTGPMSGS